MVDYYTVLGVSRDCTVDELKSAFRKAALTYHPDRNKDPKAPALFRQAVDAYTYILNEKLRSATGTGEAGTGEPGFTGQTGRPSNDLTLREILEMLKSDDDNIVREAVLHLGSYKYRYNLDIADLLIGVLRSENPMLRLACIVSMGKIGNPAFVEYIGPFIDDLWDQARYETAVALGRIGDMKGLLYLESYDRFKYRDSELIINAVGEAVYRIKKKNSLFYPSARCPYCGGYDAERLIPPYVCHECGRPFSPGMKTAATDGADSNKAGNMDSSTVTNKNDNALWRKCLHFIMFGFDDVPLNAPDRLAVKWGVFFAIFQILITITSGLTGLFKVSQNNSIYPIFGLSFIIMSFVPAFVTLWEADLIGLISRKTAHQNLSCMIQMGFIAGAISNASFLLMCLLMSGASDLTGLIVVLALFIGINTFVVPMGFYNA